MSCTTRITRGLWIALVAVSLGTACSSATGSDFITTRDVGLPLHQFVASGPLNFNGRSAPTNGGVQVILAVQNPGQIPVRVEHGACSFGVRAYASRERAGRPVWDNRLPANVACVDIGLSFAVAPGAAHDVTVGRHIPADVLGDSLPAGQYYFTVALRDPRAGLVVVPAGEANLAR